MIWCIYNAIFSTDFANLVYDILAFQYYFGDLGYFLLPILSSEATFSMISKIFAILLIISGILIGIGFFGMYRTGGGARV